MLCILHVACNKESITVAKTNFGDNSFKCALVSDSTISKSLKKLKVHIEFVTLTPDLIENSVLQGQTNVSDLVFTFPNDSDYSLNVTHLKSEIMEPEISHSSLVLFDFESHPTNLDDCISYWLNNIREGDEFAIGTLTNSSAGYKVIDEEFVTNKTDNTDVLFDLYNTNSNACENYLNAAYNAIDFLELKAKNSKRNLVLLVTEVSNSSDTEVEALIQKANDKGVSISFIGPHEYDYVSLAIKTKGFYSHSTNWWGNRSAVYAINKLLVSQFKKTTLDLEIDNITGSFGSYFGSYVNVENLASEDYYSSRLYYKAYF